MSIQKEHVALIIKAQANYLDVFYSKEFNFRNHCYLRIAFDKIVGDKYPVNFMSEIKNQMICLADNR